MLVLKIIAINKRLFKLEKMFGCEDAILVISVPRYYFYHHTKLNIKVPIVTVRPVYGYS